MLLCMRACFIVNEYSLCGHKIMYHSFIINLDMGMKKNVLNVF